MDAPGQTLRRFPVLSLSACRVEMVEDKANDLCDLITRPECGPEER